MSGDRDDEGVEIFREPTRDDDVVPVTPFAGATEAAKREPSRRVIAVSGAKGGAGKTVIATNLAIFLASIGRRVVLVDADGDGANAHTLLGFERPNEAGSPWAERPKAKDGALLVHDTSVPGLRILHAGIDEPSEGHSRRMTRRKLLRSVRELDADYAVVDLGSGTHRSLLDFWLDADLSVFVTIPEPTAIDGTYRFVRAAFARFLKRRVEDPVKRRALISRLRAMGNTPAPLDLARRLEAAGDPASDLVREAMSDLSFRFVLNQTRLRADLDLGDAMSIAVRRRFGLGVEYLGYVDHDDAVWTCVRMRRPVLVESPGTKASKSIERIARRVLAIDAGKGPRRATRSVPAESHHDLLEVERGATDEEIRRAFKRVKEIYAADALACYGLFDARSLDSLRARLEEAYDVLLDPARRRPYELSVFPPDPEPVAMPHAAESAEPKPPPPRVTPDTEFTGPLLRGVRESQGIELAEIARRTKIGIGYLDAIEADDYGSLPAPVYVRGFVTEVAKFLGLDSEQVSRTYVRRYSRWMDEREKMAR